YLVHLMSTSPQTGGQRTIYVQLEHEPEVTQEVDRFLRTPFCLIINSLSTMQGFAIGAHSLYLRTASFFLTRHRQRLDTCIPPYLSASFAPIMRAGCLPLDAFWVAWTNCANMRTKFVATLSPSIRSTRGWISSKPCRHSLTPYPRPMYHGKRLFSGCTR